MVLGRNEDAERLEREVYDIAEGVLAKRPGDIRSMKNRALAANLLGDISMDRHDLETAMRYAERSELAGEDIVRFNPSDLSSWEHWIRGRDQISDILFEQGFVERAIDKRRATVALAKDERLTDGPGGIFEDTYYNLAVLEAESGQRAAAEKSLAMAAGTTGDVRQSAARRQSDACAWPGPDKGQQGEAAAAAGRLLRRRGPVRVRHERPGQAEAAERRRRSGAVPEQHPARISQRIVSGRSAARTQRGGRGGSTSSPDTAAEHLRRPRGPACATAGHAGACACEAGSQRGGARSAGACAGALPRRAEGRRRRNHIPLPVRDGAVRRGDSAGRRRGGTAGKTAGARRCGGTTVADVRRGAAAHYVAGTRALDRGRARLTDRLSGLLQGAPICTA